MLKAKRRRRAMKRRITAEDRRATAAIEDYWATGTIMATYAEKIRRGNYTTVTIDEEDHYEALAEAAKEERIARHNGRPA